MDNYENEVLNEEEVSIDENLETVSNLVSDYEEVYVDSEESSKRALSLGEGLVIGGLMAAGAGAYAGIKWIVKKSKNDWIPAVKKSWKKRKEKENFDLDECVEE